MSTPVLLTRQRPKPLMVYDGDCGFCVKWIRRWEVWTRPAVDYAPLQQAAADFPEIPRASFEQEVKLATPDGWVYGGAQAVLRSLNLGEHPGFLAKTAWSLYRHLPGFAPLAEICYRFVARHRSFFSAATRWM